MVLEITEQVNLLTNRELMERFPVLVDYGYDSTYKDTNMITRNNKIRFLLTLYAMYQDKNYSLLASKDIFEKLDDLIMRHKSYDSVYFLNMLSDYYGAVFGNNIHVEHDLYVYVSYTLTITLTTIGDFVSYYHNVNNIHIDMGNVHYNKTPFYIELDEHHMTYLDISNGSNDRKTILQKYNSLKKDKSKRLATINNALESLKKYDNSVIGDNVFKYMVYKLLDEYITINPGYVLFLVYVINLDMNYNLSNTLKSEDIVDIEFVFIANNKRYKKYGLWDDKDLKIELIISRKDGTKEEVSIVDLLMSKSDTKNNIKRAQECLGEHNPNDLADMDPEAIFNMFLKESYTDIQESPNLEEDLKEWSEKTGFKFSNPKEENLNKTGEENMDTQNKATKPFEVETRIIIKKKTQDDYIYSPNELNVPEYNGIKYPVAIGVHDKTGKLLGYLGKNGDLITNVTIGITYAPQGAISSQAMPHQQFGGMSGSHVPTHQSVIGYNELLLVRALEFHKIIGEIQNV